jgi:hypothetical protein
MINVFFDSHLPDTKRLASLYEGQLFLFAPTQATRALCDLARENMTDMEFARKPHVKECIRKLLTELRCDLERTYIDAPRLHIAREEYPHRETWQAAPAAQITCLLTLDDTPADGGMLFYPQYWLCVVPNNSHLFDFYDRNANFRPQARGLLNLAQHMRVHQKAGSLLLYSASHFRAAESPRMWRSIDFRMVNIEDVVAHHGARNQDAHPTGTSLRTFVQARDGRRLPEELVEEYDEEPVCQGRMIFKPTGIHAN